MNISLRIYNALWYPVRALLELVALRNSKTRLAVKGRKETLARLAKGLDPGRPVCWLHAASLGEYEMGLPVLETIKSRHPDHQIVISFFSPSGYEVVQKRETGHLCVYLPWDQHGPMTEFVQTLNPRVALFVKYEVWPVCLHILAKRNVPVFLISALFRENQIFFRWYGGLMRKALRSYRRIFVQNQRSLKLLESIGIGEVEICGDTRFERVTQTLENLEPLPFMNDFLENSTLTVVAGSTWPEDESTLLSWLPSQEAGVKLILAPHEIDSSHLNQIRELVHVPYLMYTELEELDPAVCTERLRTARLLVLDTIGLLRKVYRYAGVAYVGGGYSGKLHNTLEPAVFGIPIIIGPKYDRFPEALEMRRRKGLFTVEDTRQLGELMRKFKNMPGYREESGGHNSAYVRENLGATEKILTCIEEYLK
jgi:3-deoxy-D-manno-octulosonic-acid transferase